MTTEPGVPAASRRSGRFLAALLAIVLVALALRMWTAIATQVDVPIRNDARDYISYAANLQAFGVYSADPRVLVGRQPGTPRPDARRTPGYPLFLLPWFDGHDLGGFIHRVVLVQALLGALLVALAGWLGRRLLGDRWGLAAAALVALSPHLVVYVPYLLTETLYALVLGIAVALAAFGACASGRRRAWLLALAGVGLGVSCLVRPTLDQLAWVVLAATLLLPRLRRHLRAVAWLLAGFLVVMAPWWIRNATIPREGHSHAMAITIHQGSYPDLMRDGDPATFGYPYRGDPASAAAEASVGGALADLAGKVRAHPWRMLRWYVVGKPLALFAWEEQSGWMNLFEYPLRRSPWLDSPLLRALMSAMVGLHPLLVGLGLLGTLLACVPGLARRVASPAAGPGWVVLACVHGYFLLVHLAALPLSRYSVPFRPLTYLLALFALACAAHWLGPRLGRARAAAGAAR